MQIGILDTPAFSFLVVAFGSYLAGFIIAGMSVLDDVFDRAGVVVPEAIDLSFGERGSSF